MLTFFFQVIAKEKRASSAFGETSPAALLRGVTCISNACLFIFYFLEVIAEKKKKERAKGLS
jgi:hypothetical protein